MRQVQTATVVTLKITVSDQTTYSSSSSGGGGGGGGGGSHSSKTVATSGTTPAASSLPEYVVRGTWTETEQHKWTFHDDTRTYASEWAAIYNPYADKTKGQQEYAWFWFDESGYMKTGWIDWEGRSYYCTESGEMLKDAETPDGQRVGSDGAKIERAL